jgi:hypothetical protein
VEDECAHCRDDQVQIRDRAGRCTVHGSCVP